MRAIFLDDSAICFSCSLRWAQVADFRVQVADLAAIVMAR
jgi:hypothetical protein